MNKEAIIHTKSVNMTHKTTTGRGNGRQEKIWDINQVTPEKVTMKMCRYEIHDIGTTVQRQRQCKNIVKRSLYPPVEYSPFISHYSIVYLHRRIKVSIDPDLNRREHVGGSAGACAKLLALKVKPPEILRG